MPTDDLPARGQHRLDLEDILIRLNSFGSITNQEYTYLIEHNYITETGTITSKGYSIIQNIDNGV